MAFDPKLAEIRFGTGLGPAGRRPISAAAMLGSLSGPDLMATRFPIRRYEDHLPEFKAYRDLQKRQREAKGLFAKALRGDVRDMRRAALAAGVSDLRSSVLRAAHTNDGMRERLTAFWADHFTALGKGGLLPYSVYGYIEEAIRPHVAGRFSDLLRAAVTHPLMLIYLDQNASAGPGSKAGLKRDRGLNENLAREVLELHTLGVDGPYGQKDVRELAKLFTGMSVRQKDGFIFRKGMAEPGAETVLGNAYGGGSPGMDDILAALDDLARHPSTARHIARKLAVHFVADEPDPDLIDQVVEAYIASDGVLTTVYAALLDHPAAWSDTRQKARQPIDFMAAALRALAVPEDALLALDPKENQQVLLRPLVAMGQTPGRAPGPDGWPEEASHWITPPGMAARIEWSMKAPAALLKDLPDPRRFVDDALGGLAGPDLLFAVKAAETRAAGIALVLVSPEFQRR